jgi:type III restriction enzyme
MSTFNPLRFQTKAINRLLETFVHLWKNTGRQLPLVFKSPTGSGKTFMTAHFVRGLSHLPNWNVDKAFIWITFSDDLAMQSKNKFREYFSTTLENGLLTVNDINQGKLFMNDIIFLNWQKVVARNAESRVLRRPEDEKMSKESGKYFEDVIEATKADGREIILIIDEAHKNKSTELAQNIIDFIDPKVIIHVTATPKDQDALLAYQHKSFIEIDRIEVVEEGLIKEKISVQTTEDLLKHKKEDFDGVLLELGMQKREELKTELLTMGKNINPLMIIQLPNDDKERVSLGEKTKEEVVTQFLKSKGVADIKIAKWFDGKQEHMDYIDAPESDIDFMLFKQAAGTGWDCPRASILVMFREIKSKTFYTQTIGRILRMPEPNCKEDYKEHPNLKVGYLYTNYERQEISIPDQSENNKPYIYTAKRKDGIENIKLQSAYVSRLDYGDIPHSYKFQMSFKNSMNQFFGITKNDILGKSESKLTSKGVDLNGSLTNKIIVDASFTDFDQMALGFQEQGIDVDVEMSTNDVEKTFNYLCYILLKEQDDENAKYTNIARSWGVLKSAIRIWFQSVLGQDSDYYYRVFIKDIQKGASSKFRPAITKALSDFKPVSQELLKDKKKKQEEREAPIFTIRDEYKYTEDYDTVPQERCALNASYFLKEYDGHKNELAFKDYIDGKEKVSWWFKNGDQGKEYFAIRYHNTVDQKDALFYPDWIIRFNDGKIGIFDTKNGKTATDQETRDKSEALAQRLPELGKEYIGGIAIFENGVWYFNDGKKYEYIEGKSVNESKEWKRFETLFE